MIFGISCYCLDPVMAAGEMSPEALAAYVAEIGCEHMELVPFSLPFVTSDGLNSSLIQRVKRAFREVGIPLSAYSLNADLLMPDLEARNAEIERVKKHMQAAAELGIPLMRHDIASFRRPFSKNTQERFEEELPLMVEGSRLLFDYAASLGLLVTLENHGFFCNGSDRMLRLLEAIDRPGLGMTLDVGNFLCVDENPSEAVRACAPYAKMVHFKDFYLREKSRLPGQSGLFDCNMGSWFETMGGKLLRGAITGQGDMDLFSIADILLKAGFNGPVSVEFEGMEECKKGTQISFAMTQAIFREVKGEI
jgi:sugar phosphate isomerase/epimerase